MKTAVLLLLSVLLCSCAWSAGEDVSPTDQPFNQPVTLAVKGEALSDIMAMLSKQTGVKLRTTRDIADQKATIFVDKRPLREVITGLKTIFGYRFSVVSVGNAKVYELWESLSTKQAREAAMNGALAQAWQEADKRLKEIIQLSKGDPDVLKQLEAKKDRTPEETAKLALLRDAFGIGSDIAELYFRLPPETTRSVSSGWKAFFDSETSESEWRLPGDIDKSLTKKVTDPSVDWPGRPSAGYNVSIGFHQQGEVLSVTGSCAGFWPELDKSWTLGAGLGGTITIPRVQPERPSVQLPNKPDDGVLGKEITLTAKELTDESGISQWSGSPTRVNRSDVLSLLHRQLGLQVISDHYSVWFDWDMNGTQTAKRLLEHFVEMKTTPDWRDWANTSVDERTRVSDPLWGWDGSYLYMRERSPYELDAAEVPNKLLDSLRMSLSNRHCLDLDDIASMFECGRRHATTGYAPWGFLLGADYNKQLISPGDQANSLMALHLYGSLSDVQRRRILAAGMRVQDMSPEQLSCLALLLTDQRKNVFGQRRVGLYVYGVRIDKPQIGDNTPVLIRVERRTSKRFVLAKLRSTGAVQGTEAASPNDALSWFHEHYPDLVNKPHFFGRDAGYVMVLSFGDGTTNEYPMVVYEPVVADGEK